MFSFLKYRSKKTDVKSVAKYLSHTLYHEVTEVWRSNNGGIKYTATWNCILVTMYFLVMGRFIDTSYKIGWKYQFCHMISQYLRSSAASSYLYWALNWFIFCWTGWHRCFVFFFLSITLHLYRESYCRWHWITHC